MLLQATKYDPVRYSCLGLSFISTMKMVINFRKFVTVRFYSYYRNWFAKQFLKHILDLFSIE